MPAIVDTNVLLVANGAASQASPDCVLNCVRRLRSIVDDIETLVLDDNWQVIHEYGTVMHDAGQPGVGYAFLKWVLTNWTNPRRCTLTSISGVTFPADPDLTTFDLSDRIFVLLSLAHVERPPVWNAVDTDWWLHRKALNRNGIRVEFICENHMIRFAQRHEP